MMTSRDDDFVLHIGPYAKYKLFFSFQKDINLRYDTYQLFVYFFMKKCFKIIGYCNLVDAHF